MLSTPLVARLALLVLLPSLQQSAPKSPPAPPPPKIDEKVATALKWLPDDTDSVIVANGPFRFHSQQPADHRDPDAFYKQEKVSFVDLIRQSVLTLGLFLNAGTGSPPSKGLLDLEFEFALEGSRKFRPPKGFGMTSYEGALVLSVGKSEIEKLDAAVAAVDKAASEHLQIADTPVFILHGNEESGMPALLAARPRPGLLCVSNDRSYLETVLQRIARPAATAAFPAELEEWKHVDPNASVFALRHFRQAGAAEDPTSPLREKTSSNFPDPKAVGLVFECRDGPSQTAIARYLTGAPDPIRLVQPAWTMEGEGLKPEFTLAGPGVVTISHVVDQPLPASRYWFVLLGHLGHAIYL